MKYTARDHAFVYGVIAEELLRLYPERTDVLEKGIKVYGLQRGSRMAQTAEAFGDPRNMRTYLAYGEWAPTPGEMDIDIPQSSPVAVWNVKKCPWSQEWREQGMTDVGKYYCRFVDRELVHGFNPELELGTGTTQTNGDEFCYFAWNGADMNDENKALNAEIAGKVGSVRIRPWSYHMGHIYKTLGETIAEMLGSEARRSVYEAADARIAERYGEQTVELMHTGLMLDYWVTPSLKKAGLLPDMFD